MSQSWRHSPSKRLLRSSIKPVWWLSWYQSAQVTNEQNQGCLRYLGDEVLLFVVGFILSHYRKLGIPIKKPGFNGRKFDKTQPESGVLYFLGFAKYQRGWSLAFPPAICLWNGEGMDELVTAWALRQLNCFYLKWIGNAWQCFVVNNYIVDTV